MSPAVIFAAILMGLTGSLHCAGMCGPIIWIMPFQQYTGVRKVLGVLLYHLGRISAYAGLGIILHLFRGLFHPQWQQYFSIVAGLMLLLVGLVYFLPQLGVRISLPWTASITRALGHVMPRRNPFWLFAAGALNGLLPCGMVYMALAVAVTLTEHWQAATIMYAFGLGTLPMMLTLTFLKGRISFSFIRFRRWTPVLLFAFGSLFILRGANLGIPLISPKVVMAKQVMKLDCCHKPH